ncbi:uncharacterized protein LOC135370678 [Ornithodoros turicata]|uniref:uncharacterized protein LOC135370678 n=1 Tax=Ornithodoros turicata TaxID=34597 RepID=UPI003139AAEE
MKSVLALYLLLAAVHAAPLEVRQNPKQTGVPHELQPFVTNSEEHSSSEETERIFKIHSNFGGLRRLSDDPPSESGGTSPDSGETSIEESEEAEVKTLQPFGGIVQGSRRLVSLDSSEATGEHVEDAEESSSPEQLKIPLDTGGLDKRGLGYSAAEDKESSVIGGGSTVTGTSPGTGVVDAAASSDKLAPFTVGGKWNEDSQRTLQSVPAGSNPDELKRGLITEKEIRIHGALSPEEERATDVSEYAITGGSFGQPSRAAAVGVTPGSASSVSKVPGSDQPVPDTGVATPHAEIAKDTEDAVSVRTRLEDATSAHEVTGNKKSAENSGGVEGVGKGQPALATSVVSSGAGVPVVPITYTFHSFADNNESGEISLPTVRDGQDSVVIKDLAFEPLRQSSKPVAESGTVGQGAGQTEGAQDKPEVLNTGTRVFHGPPGGYGIKFQGSKINEPSFSARDIKDESETSQRTGEFQPHGTVAADVKGEDGAAVSGGKLDSSASSAPVRADQHRDGNVPEGTVVGTMSRQVTFGDASGGQASTTAGNDEEGGGGPEDGSRQTGQVFGGARNTVGSLPDFVSTGRATDARVREDEMNDSTLPSVGDVSTSDTSPTDRSDHEKSFDTGTSFHFREGSERPKAPSAPQKVHSPGKNDSTTASDPNAVFPTPEKQESASSNAENLQPMDGGASLLKSDVEETSVTDRDAEAQGPIHVMLSGKGWSVATDDASFLESSPDMRKELTEFATHLRKVDFPSLSEDFGRRLNADRPSGVPISADQHGVFKVGSSLKDTLEEFDKLIGDEDGRSPEVARTGAAPVHESQMTATGKEPSLEEPIIPEEASLLCPEGVHKPEPADGSRHASHVSKCRDRVTKDLSGPEVSKEQASEQNPETNGFVHTKPKSYSGDLPARDVPSEAALPSGKHAEQGLSQESGGSDVSLPQVREHGKEGEESGVTRDLDESYETKKSEERKKPAQSQSGVVVFLAESRDSATDGISLQHGPGVGEQEPSVRQNNDEVAAHGHDDGVVQQGAVSESSVDTLEPEPKLTAEGGQVLDREHSASKGKEEVLLDNNEATPANVEGKAEDAATTSLGGQKTEGGMPSMRQDAEAVGHDARGTAEMHGVSDTLHPEAVGIPTKHTQDVFGQSASTTGADGEQHAADQMQHDGLGGALRGVDKEKPDVVVKDASVAAAPEADTSDQSQQAEYQSKQAENDASTESKADGSVKDEQTVGDSHGEEDEEEYPKVQVDESFREGLGPSHGSDGYIPAEAREQEENTTRDGTEEPGTTVTVTEAEITSQEAPQQQDTGSDGLTDSTEQHVPEKQDAVADGTASGGNVAELPDVSPGKFFPTPYEYTRRPEVPGHTTSDGDEYDVPKLPDVVDAAESHESNGAGISQKHDVTDSTQAPGLRLGDQSVPGVEEQYVPSAKDHTQGAQVPQDSHTVHGLDDQDLPAVRDHTQDGAAVPGAEEHGVPPQPDHTQGPEESEDGQTVRGVEEQDLPVVRDHSKAPGLYQDQSVRESEKQGMPSFPHHSQGPEVSQDDHIIRGPEEQAVPIIRDHTQAPGVYQEEHTVNRDEEQGVPSLPDHTQGPEVSQDGQVVRGPEEQGMPIGRDQTEIPKSPQDDHTLAVTKEVDDHLDVSEVPGHVPVVHAHVETDDKTDADRKAAVAEERDVVHDASEPEDADTPEVALQQPAAVHHGIGVQQGKQTDPLIPTHTQDHEPVNTLKPPSVPTGTSDVTHHSLPCDHPTLPVKATTPQHDTGPVVHQTVTGVHQQQQHEVHPNIPSLQYHPGVVTAPHLQPISTGTLAQEQGPFGISHHYANNFGSQHQDPQLGSVSLRQPSPFGPPHHYPGGFIIVHHKQGDAGVPQVQTGVPHNPQHHLQGIRPALQFQTDVPRHEPSSVGTPVLHAHSGAAPLPQPPQPHQLGHAVGPSDSVQLGGAPHIQPDGVVRQQPPVISGAEHQPHDGALRHVPGIHGPALQRELGTTSLTHQHTGAVQLKTPQPGTYFHAEHIPQHSPGSAVSFVQHGEPGTIQAPAGYPSADFPGFQLQEPVPPFGLLTADPLQTPKPTIGAQPQQDDPIAKYFVGRVVAPAGLPQENPFGSDLSTHFVTQAQNNHSQQTPFPVTSQVQHFAGAHTPGTSKSSPLTPGVQAQPTFSTLPQAPTAHEFPGLGQLGQLVPQQQPASPDLETVRIPYPPFYITFKRDQTSVKVPPPNQHAYDSSPEFPSQTADAKPYEDSGRAFGGEGTLRDLEASEQGSHFGRILVSEGPVTFQAPAPDFHFNAQAFGAPALTPLLPNYGERVPVFEQPRVFAPVAGHHNPLLHGHFNPLFHQQPLGFYNNNNNFPGYNLEASASSKSKRMVQRPSKMLKSLRQAVASKLSPSGLQPFTRFRSGRQQSPETAKGPKLLSSRLAFRQQRRLPHLQVRPAPANQFGLRVKA